MPETGPAYAPYPGGPSFNDAPAPRPAAPAAAPAKAGLTANDLIKVMLVGFGLVVGGLSFNRYVLDPGEPAHAVVNAARLGKSFGPEVAASFGDGCLAAAATVESGRTMSEAQADLQKAFKDSRVAAFDRVITPEMNKVITPGTEPADPTTRAGVVKFFRDLGHGLKGGR